MRKSLLCAAAALVAFAAIGPVRAMEYKTGGVATMAEVEYGKWEVRAKLGMANGVCNAMFLWHNGCYANPPVPNWAEVDIEIIGKAPQTYKAAIHAIPGGCSMDHSDYAEFDHSTDLADDYHTYGIEWTPDEIRWLFDGQVKLKMGTEKNGVVNMRGHGCRLDIMNWLGQWPGTPNKADFPRAMFISWVKQYEYTPGAGDNGSDFSLLWHDEFNGDDLDGTRWFRYGWNGSPSYQYSDYVKENSVVRDGYLIIAMNLETQDRGWAGAIPNDPLNGDAAVDAQYWPNRAALPSDVAVSDNAVTYSLTKSERMQIGLHDLTGRLVQTLVSGNQEAGTHTVSLDRTALPAGSYLLRFESPSRSGTYRLIDTH